MLRITIELVPHGDESRKRAIGYAEIRNDGTGDRQTGNYGVRLSQWGRPGSTWKRGVVTGFPRLKLGPWDLLYLALDACVGGRNKQKTEHGQ